MALNKIQANSGVFWNQAIARTQGGKRTSVDRYIGITNVTGINARLDVEQGSWGWGTGQIIDSTGTLIFNSEVAGGSLAEVTLTNFGPNHCFIGINSETPSVASGIYLGTGMTFSSYVQMHDIWAISIGPTGTSALKGGGPYTYMKDSI